MASCTASKIRQRRKSLPLPAPTPHTPAAHILPTSRPRTHRRKPMPTMATEAATPATQPSLSPTQATTYLTQFIGRNLRIHVTDKRMFIGQMKCTDKASPARLTTTAYH